MTQNWSKHTGDIDARIQQIIKRAPHVQNQLHWNLLLDSIPLDKHAQILTAVKGKLRFEVDS